MQQRFLKTTGPCHCMAGSLIMNFVRALLVLSFCHAVSILDVFLFRVTVLLLSNDWTLDKLSLLAGLTQ